MSRRRITRTDVTNLRDRLRQYEREDREKYAATTSERTKAAYSGSVSAYKLAADNLDYLLGEETSGRAS